MTRMKAFEDAPADPAARISYVEQLRAMYVDGSLDDVLSKEFTDVPDLLLAELFPRLFPLVH